MTPPVPPKEAPAVPMKPPVPKGGNTEPPAPTGGGGRMIPPPGELPILPPLPTVPVPGGPLEAPTGLLVVLDTGVFAAPRLLSDDDPSREAPVPPGACAPLPPFDGTKSAPGRS